MNIDLPVSVISKIDVDNLQLLEFFNNILLLIGIYIAVSILLLVMPLPFKKYDKINTIFAGLLLLWIVGAPLATMMFKNQRTYDIMKTLCNAGYTTETQIFNYKLSDLDYSIHDNEFSVYISELNRLTDKTDTYVDGSLSFENVQNIILGITSKVDGSETIGLFGTVTATTKTHRMPSISDIHVNKNNVVTDSSVTETTLKVIVETKTAESGWEDYLQDSVTVESQILMPVGTIPLLQ